MSSKQKRKLSSGDDGENDSSEEEVEQLTHFGQSLSEMENFKDPIVGDLDDDDSDDGRITGKNDCFTEKMFVIGLHKFQKQFLLLCFFLLNELCYD